LPTGDILMTGGGISNAVFLITFKKRFIIMNKRPMAIPRKEHSAVVLNNKVYVLGGYNS
jgi:hypothetical protein